MDYVLLRSIPGTATGTESASKRTERRRRRSDSPSLSDPFSNCNSKIQLMSSDPVVDPMSQTGVAAKDESVSDHDTNPIPTSGHLEPSRSPTNNKLNNNHQNKDTFYTATAHRARRIYHVLIFTAAPIFYFWTAPWISDQIGISVAKILSFLILLFIVLECIRLKRRFIIWGMREYERDHISAQTWGCVSTLIVFLMAFPRTYSIGPIIDEDGNGETRGSEAFACFGQLAIPIVWTLGFGDPLLGELKRMVRTERISPWIMYLIAECALLMIWICCFLWCGTPWILAVIIPPIAIIAEKPSIPHIDDNGLMLLVPLLCTLILEPWFQRQCDQIFYQ